MNKVLLQEHEGPEGPPRSGRRGDRREVCHLASRVIVSAAVTFVLTIT